MGAPFDTVNGEMLIQNVHVSPVAPSWFRELVESASKHYGLERESVQSDLTRDPI